MAEPKAGWVDLLTPEQKAAKWIAPPEQNKPAQYYVDYLTKLASEVNKFDLRTGYLRWLQGTALKTGLTYCSKTADGAADKKAIKDASGLPKSTYYAVLAVAKIPEDKAKTMTWTDMLIEVGYYSEPANSTKSKTLDGKSKKNGKGKLSSGLKENLDILKENWTMTEQIILADDTPKKDRQACLTVVAEIAVAMITLADKYGVHITPKQNEPLPVKKAG